jgi:Tol biopolymer transport system component
MHPNRTFLLAAVAFPLATGVGPTLAAGSVTELVSVSTGGKQGNGLSTAPSVSGDGRLVVFDSQATNFVHPDTTGGFDDIFLRDRATGKTVLVSVSSAGVQGFGQSADPLISRNGRFVAFASAAANLVPGDTNKRTDVFLRDLKVGKTARVSLGPGGIQPDDTSVLVAISASARFVLFSSFATNIGPGGGEGQLYVRDRKSGTTVLQPTNADGRPLDQPVGEAAITPDGRYLVFDSDGSDVLPGGVAPIGGVFRLDRTTGTTEIASVGKGGKPSNSFSFGASVSDDGNLVAFQSDATNLAPGGTGGHVQVYVRDLKAGKTARISAAPSGAAGDSDSVAPLVSPDGRRVLFFSYAENLVPDLKVGPGRHLFLRDLATKATTAIDVTPSGVLGKGSVFTAATPSADGRTIAFSSTASNLVAGDRNGQEDVFVRVLDGKGR